MSSSPERAGRDLLNRWNDSSAEIQVVLTGGGVIGFTIQGIVSGFVDDRLGVVGSKCECVLDLTDADFIDVATEETLIELGLSPEAYSETITISLAPFGKLVLSLLPLLRPDPRPN